MKLTIDQPVLDEALKRAALAAARGRSPMVILDRFHLEATVGTLTIRATDLTTSIVLTIPAEVHESGIAPCPDAAELSTFVAGLNAGAVELSSDERQLTVVSGTSRGRFGGLDPSDFPGIAPFPDDGAVTMDGEQLRTMIGLVAFAAAPDDSRPVLAGVRIEIRDDAIMMAAADGFVMAFYEANMPDPAPHDIEALAPASACRDLAKLLPDGPVYLAVDERGTRLQAAGDGWAWTARQLDGTYPDVRQLVPRDPATVTTVARDALLRAVRRASPWGRNLGKPRVMIECRTEDSTLRVWTADDTGGGETTLRASDPAGPDLDTLFNPAYLLPALAAARGEWVTFGSSGATQAGIWRFPEHPGYAFVAMPVIVGDQ